MRLDAMAIAQIVKAHCQIAFGETVHLHRLRFAHGQWDVEAQAIEGKIPVGPRFGLLVSAEGELLEDALDTEND